MGIVTRSDINDALILGNDQNTAVEKIMNPKAVVAYPDTDLYTVYFRLRLNNSERAIVIDRRKFYQRNYYAQRYPCCRRSETPRLDNSSIRIESCQSRPI